MKPAPYPPLRGNEPCRTGDPDRFFPERGEALVAAASKAECEPCPVREACLQWALIRGEPGIWGGTSETERIDMRRRLGVKVERHSSRALTRDLVLRMYARHVAIKTIAEVAGVGQHTVEIIIRNYRREVRAS